MKFTRKGVIAVIAVIVAILFIGGGRSVYKKYTKDYVYDSVRYVDGQPVGAVGEASEVTQVLVNGRDDSKVSDLKTYSNPEYGITFQYPAKYIPTQFPKGSEGLLPFFQYKDPNKTLSSVPDFLDVRWLSVKNGDNVEEVMMKDVVYDGSGFHPKSFNAFTPVRLGDNDFYKILTGTFEGVLGYRYYLVKSSGAFVFVLTSNGVPWTEPLFDPEKDTRHLELQEMLKTVKIKL